jgi:ABC-type multidrug transport system fused ATPase/permease subunit
MNNFTNQTFYISSSYLKDFQKRTWIFILFLVSIILLNYYYVWILATSPAKQIKTNNNLVNIFSELNPFKTQEDYIFFLVFGIFPIFSIGVCIFWARARKIKRLCTKTMQITIENFTQIFENKITQNLSWSQVKRVALYRKNSKEILYIKIYDLDNKEFIVYGMYPWDELLNYIQEICEFKNIEIDICNARIGSKEYLLGSPDLSIMLTMPTIVIANQLKAIGLQLPAYICVASYTVIIFTYTAFFTQPLDSNRSKYKYWSFSLMILGLATLIWLIKFKF